MNFSFHPKGQWSQLNEKAAEIFGVNEARNQLRVYRNSAEAVLELALGFFQQFPLKKKFFYFKNLDPHFDLAITALSKLGLQARALEITDMAKPEVWQNELDREAGIFLYSYDNPVTGALNATAELDRILKEKSIFRMTLSHATYFSAQNGMQVVAPSEIERSEIQVRQTPTRFAGQGLALAYVGERGRFGAITAEASTPCTPQDLLTLKSQLLEAASSNASLSARVRQHGAELASHFNLIQPEARDRLVFYFDNIDGHAYLALLASSAGLPLQPPGVEPRFETTSLSRWGGLKTMDWLQAHGLTPAQVRGLVVLLPDFLKEYSPAELREKLIETRREVLKRQNGELET